MLRASINPYGRRYLVFVASTHLPCACQFFKVSCNGAPPAKGSQLDKFSAYINAESDHRTDDAMPLSKAQIYFWQRITDSQLQLTEIEIAENILWTGFEANTEVDLYGCMCTAFAD